MLVCMCLSAVAGECMLIWVHFCVCAYCTDVGRAESSGVGPQGSDCLCFLSTSIASTHQHTWSFMWVLGTELGPQLARQAVCYGVNIKTHIWNLKIQHLYIAHILLLLFNQAFFPSATVCVGPGDEEMMLLYLLIILFCCVKVLLTYTNSFILQSASFKLSASNVPDFLSLTTDCQCFKTADMGIYNCDLNLTPGSILN